MKKILVLFATVVVMMMVTGCENPADVHIPTQEELWVAEGYRYCGNLGNDEIAQKNLKDFFGDNDTNWCQINNSNGNCYIKSFETAETAISNLVHVEDYYCYWLNNLYVKATNGNGVWDVKIMLKS